MTETVLEWEERGTNKKHRIVNVEINDGWLVLKMKQVGRSWTVDDSWFSKREPAVKTEATQ